MGATGRGAGLLRDEAGVALSKRRLGARVRSVERLMAYLLAIAKAGGLVIGGSELLRSRLLVAVSASLSRRLP